VAIEEKIAYVGTLRDLRLLLSQDEVGLARFVFSRLRIGDIWWIPDAVTGFADKERHPWVITKGYCPHRATIVACPRTTLLKGQYRGIMTPANILPGLDRAGLVEISFRRSFRARDFREYEYIGRFPDEYIKRIRDFLDAVLPGRATV
jgi:hypothetical protein